MQPKAIRKYVNVLFKSLWAVLEARWGGGKGALSCLGFRQRENFSVGISVKRFCLHAQRMVLVWMRVSCVTRTGK